MKKVGSIYSKGANKENHLYSIEMPTRRKESVEIKSTYTATSLQEAGHYQGRSTSINSQSYSQFSNASHSQSTLREEYHTFGDNSLAADSCFDSLDMYCQDAALNNTMFTKLKCLQSIFKEIKMLRAL